jgi:hypothetical protein
MQNLQNVKLKPGNIFIILDIKDLYVNTAIEESTAIMKKNM